MKYIERAHIQSQDLTYAEIAGITVWVHDGTSLSDGSNGSYEVNSHEIHSEHYMRIFAHEILHHIDYTVLHNTVAEERAHVMWQDRRYLEADSYYWADTAASEGIALDEAYWHSGPD